MSKSEFLIVPKGTKFAGPGKLGLRSPGRYQKHEKLEKGVCKFDVSMCLGYFRT